MDLQRSVKKPLADSGGTCSGTTDPDPRPALKGGSLLFAHPAPPSATISLLSVLVLGFVLGMRHATDADHVVAISTIVSRERRIASAAWIGALWGAGHTLTIFAVGVGIIVFTLVIPPRVGLSMEFSVGLMLVLLGWLNLRGFSKLSETHPQAPATPEQDPHPHRQAVTHRHALAESTVRTMDGWLGRWTWYQWLRPLLIGLVHGLAGSAAVSLLVLTTLHDTRWALAYLLIFGGGTIAGMMVITIAMASALHFAGSRSAWIHRRLSVVTGWLSVALGLFIVYQMGFACGLFTSNPVWTPQ